MHDVQVDVDDVLHVRVYDSGSVDDGDEDDGDVSISNITINTINVLTSMTRQLASSQSSTASPRFTRMHMQNMSSIHLNVMCTSSSRKTAAKHKFRTEVNCSQYVYNTTETGRLASSLSAETNTLLEGMSNADPHGNARVGPRAKCL